MITVEEILNMATDSVNLINSINSGTWEIELSQSEINDMVQRNVDHLEIILAYEEVVADESDKSSYTGAVTTGQAYITANS